MILNSVMNEGLSGMQQSQRKMQQAAQDIVQAGIATDAKLQNPAGTGAVPSTNAGTSVDDLPATATVEAAQPGTRSAGSDRKVGDVVEPLIEQRQQKLIFDASANMVQAANETLGKLIDDLS